MWIEFRSTKSANLLIVQLAEAGCAFSFFVKDGKWRRVSVADHVKDKYKRMLYLASQTACIHAHNISQSLYDYKKELIEINRKRQEEKNDVDRT